MEKPKTNAWIHVHSLLLLLFALGALGLGLSGCSASHRGVVLREMSEAPLVLPVEEEVVSKPAPAPVVQETPKKPADLPLYPDREEGDEDKIQKRTRMNALFSKNGQPLYGFTKKLRERFGDRLNRAIPARELSSSDRAKYLAIYSQLRRATDRTRDFEKNLLFIDKADAKIAALKFEKEGVPARLGAWTIAVDITAKVHGFANVPCAEFMSEIVRQAYARAGFNPADDFNRANGNPLIWSETASVTGLSRALFKAGWVPYETKSFRPPVGAIMMHTTGQSPSHTFAVAGDSGQLVVDNGSPKGRNLRTTKAKTLKMMFQSGVFFLPPGITPQTWDQTAAL